MQGLALEGGFQHVSTDAAEAFRHIMTAMARPGEIRKVTGATPPAPLSVAAGVVLLTLCDSETGIYLSKSYDIAAVRDWISFHTAAPFVEADAAQFALGPWPELPLAQFQIGTTQYPDRSATLIVEMNRLEPRGVNLQGPGIQHQATLSLPEKTAFASNAARFPLGLDFIFTAGSRIAALPRTTKVS